MTRRRERAPLSLGLRWLTGGALLACGDGAGPGSPGPLPADVAVTFVVAGIAEEIRRVDIAVTPRGGQPILGSFQTSVTDRLTLRVPRGDSLNAFARGFDAQNQIVYMGETYFHVRDSAPQVVPIRLEYKGPHVPLGAQRVQNTMTPQVAPRRLNSAGKLAALACTSTASRFAAGSIWSRLMVPVVPI